MWKWFGGCAALVVVLAICAGVWGYSKYEKFTAAGGSTTVIVHAPADRVFASLANGDSLSTWTSDSSTSEVDLSVRDKGRNVTAAWRDGRATTSRHGLLQPGDTIHIESNSRESADAATFTWMVTEVLSNRLLALELRNDRSGAVTAIRRDSLIASGDSTLIVCTVASPMMDSVRTAAHDTGGAARSRAVDMGSKLLLSAFRLESEVELKRLKAHIEGPPAPTTKR